MLNRFGFLVVFLAGYKLCFSCVLKVHLCVEGLVIGGLVFFQKHRFSILLPGLYTSLEQLFSGFSACFFRLVHTMNIAYNNNFIKY